MHVSHQGVLSTEICPSQDNVDPNGELNSHTSLPPIPCSPIPKSNAETQFHAEMHDISMPDFSFLHYGSSPPSKTQRKQENKQCEENMDKPTEEKTQLQEDNSIDSTRLHSYIDSGYSFSTAVDEAFYRLKCILKEVLYKMEDSGFLDEFSNLIHALHSGSVPVDCLPLLLCYEVAKFKNLTSTTCMSYSAVTLQFWRMLYKMLGGGVTRALSGPKNISQVVTQEATRGRYDPRKSKINFAVPSEKILANIPDQISKVIPPGIIPSTLDILVSKAKNGAEFVLSFDSKLVGPGVTGERDGDVDMWGFEFPNLEKTLMQKQRELSVMQSIGKYPITSPETFLKKCMHAWKIISGRLKALRRYISDEHKNKLRAQAKIRNNPDSAKKYSYGLSKVNANIYLAQEAVKESLSFIRSLTEIICHIRGTGKLLQSQTVHFGKQMNCFCLLPPVYIGQFLDLAQHNECIKQRSLDWFSMRKAARVTGSTAHNALGLRGLPTQKKHYEQYVTGLSPTPPDAGVKSKMEHGTAFEPHAVATVCGSAAPSYLPNCYAFFETGLHWIHSPLQSNLIEVSPDGYLQCMNGDTCANKSMHGHVGRIAMEIKCPYPSADDYMHHPHYDVPMYYVIQLLLEMKVLQTNRLWYVSSTKMSTTVHSVTFDETLYEMCYQMIEQQYAGPEITVPQKLNAKVKELKSKLKLFVRTHCKFIFEIPTLSGHEDDMVAGESPYCLLPMLPHEEVSLDKINNASQELGTRGQSLIDRIHQQMRAAADEVGVFMISDSDRIHDPDAGNSWPLAYVLKGKKMNASQLRGLLDKCIQVLKDHSIPLLCVCVDGQWSKLCFRDADNRPLTRLTLQKDTWKCVGKLSKTGCLKLIDRATTPFPGDLDLLSSLCSKPECTSFVNITIATLQGKLMLSSIGCPVNKVPLLPHVRTLERSNSHWESNEAVKAPKRNNCIGLQPGENNILSAVPHYFIRNVLGEDPTEVNGAYCFAHLETLLKHPSFTLLDDIINALTKINGNWAGYGRDDLFPDVLQDVHYLNTTCTVQELRAILRMMKKFTKRIWGTQEMLKVELCNAIVSAFGSDEVMHGPRNRKRGRPAPKIDSPSKLSTLAKKVILKNEYPTMCLRIAIARGIHATKLTEWEKASPTPLQYSMPPNGEILQSFSQPAFNLERQQLELITMDATHMLTNLRTNVLKGDGFLFASKDSWRKIANEKPEVLSRSIVYDNVDCQSAAFAKRVFSHAVENEMLRNGDTNDALFVRHVRNWYAAADMRGVDCHKRMEVFHDMHKMLTQNIDFNEFPPCGAYVNGIPHITYQAILQNITSRLQIFGISPKGSFNQRVVGTLPCESAFADMVHLDRDGLGAPKAINIPRIISKMMHLNVFKHNPEKPFLYHTSNKKVYPVQITMTPMDITLENTDEYFKNHFFDHIDIRNPESRPRCDDITKGKGPLRGVQGIRQFYKIQENLIPEEQRLGLSNISSITSNDSDWLCIEQTG